jgi:peptidoglycan hydrolase-like protein with peptidoglycan-binding domain
MLHALKKTILALLVALFLVPAFAFASFDRPLSLGATGPDVSALQQILKDKGFYAYPEITGYYGQVTLQAVADFQKSQGLEPLGYVGPSTRALLNKEAVPMTVAPNPPLLSSLISQLQQLLRNAGYYMVSLTGVLDQATLSAAQSISSGTNAAPQRSGGKPQHSDDDEEDVPDTIAPVLSAISSSPSDVSGTVSWTTDEASDSQVEYGTSSAYSASSTLDAALSTSHSVPLSGLAATTLYHFRVLSRDGAGNLATSSDQTFTTSATPDITPPGISAIASSTSTATATITWTTDEASDSRIDYGTTASYGSASTSAALSTSHSITLTDLYDSVTYHFRIRSADAMGNAATSTDLMLRTAALATLGRTETALPAYLVPTNSAARWNGLISYGQSLSIGAQGQPVLSTSQPYSNLTFQGGPKVTLTGNTFGGTNQFDMTASVPLVEDNGNGDGSGIVRGETIVSGAANGSVALAIAEDGANPSDLVWFASAAGKGDSLISILAKGQPWYQNYIDHVTKAKAIATANGKTYQLTSIVWMQGEANSATTRASYKNTARALFENMQADAMVITGQTVKPHVVVYQSTYAIQSGGGPALALLDLANERDDVHMGAPIYNLPFATDNVHLSNVGYLWAGHLYARALKDVLVDGIAPEHVNPIAVTQAGNDIHVQFHVPVGPLRLDTVTLAPTDNYGFSVSSSNGLATISSIALEGTDTVRITVGSTLGTNPVVRYAMDELADSLTISGGGSGNLRDSTPDTFTDNGVTYPLYRVSPAFEVPVGYAYNANPNLFTNGGFDADADWTKGANWTISSGVATKSASGSAQTITQAPSREIGATYILSYTITARTAGSVQARWDGAVVGTARTAPGTYQETLVATVSAGQIGLSASASFGGSVDNVSLVKAP